MNWRLVLRIPSRCLLRPPGHLCSPPTSEIKTMSLYIANVLGKNVFLPVSSWAELIPCWLFFACFGGHLRIPQKVALVVLLYDRVISSLLAQWGLADLSILTYHDYLGYTSVIPMSHNTTEVTLWERRKLQYKHVTCVCYERKFWMKICVLFLFKFFI